MSWLSVRYNCEDIIFFVRNILNWIASFLTDPDLYDNISSQVNGAVGVNGGFVDLGSAVKATGLTLCVLFFLIDFFQKSLHLQWVTWENVLMFFMKLFVAKVVLSNAGLLLSMIQNGFASIIGNATLHHGLGWALFPDDEVSYFLAPGTEEYTNVVDSPNHLWGDVSLMAGFTNIGITIIGLIMRVVFAITAIIIIARLFELLVYTVIAPIPLATLSCEGLQDVGKGFLKSYAAVCLQAVVIVIMIKIYSVMLNGSNAALLHLDSLDQRWITLLMTFIFGAGIMQSGSLAKKFCGAM